MPEPWKRCAQVMKAKGNTKVKLSNLTLDAPSQNVTLQRENGAPGGNRTPDILLRRQEGANLKACYGVAYESPNAF